MIENLAEFFKAISDQTRQRIINLLLHAQALNVNEIARILEVPQSKISRNLSILRHAGWVIYNRREKWIYYKLNPKLDKELLNALKRMFKNYIQFETDLKKSDF